MLVYYHLPHYPTTLPPTKENRMNYFVDYTQNILNALIDRTLTIIDNGLDRSVGDMKLLEALELVGVLMDIRERQQAYERNQPKPNKACQKACGKKPKCKVTNGL